MQIFSVCNRLGIRSAAARSSFFISITASSIGNSSSLVFSAARSVRNGTTRANFFFLALPSSVTEIVDVVDMDLVPSLQAKSKHTRFTHKRHFECGLIGITKKKEKKSAEDIVNVGRLFFRVP